jgi:hypothetical protein
MLKDIEKLRKWRRNEGQRIEIMLAQTHTRQAPTTARRPIYDSIWLAFFELLREQLAGRPAAAFNRGGNLSPRQ